MTVYIDNLKPFGHRYCHMMTDGDIEELHDAAKKIGVTVKWFYDHPRHPHYKVVKPKRFRAIINGAIPLGNTRELLALCEQV